MAFFFVLVCAPNETHTTHTHIQVHAYNKKRFQFYVCSLLVEILREKKKKQKNIFVNLNRFFFLEKEENKRHRKTIRLNTHEIQNM
jgi:hypothetical protein